MQHVPINELHDELCKLLYDSQMNTLNFDAKNANKPKSQKISTTSDDVMK